MSDVTSKKMSSLEGPVHPTHALRVRLKKMVGYGTGRLGSQLVVLFGEVQEIRPCWKKYSTGVQDLCYFHFHSLMWVCIRRCEFSASCSLCYVFLMLPCFPVMMDPYPSGSLCSNKIFFSEFPCLHLLSQQQRDPETLAKLSECQVTQVLKLKTKFTTTVLKYWQGALQLRFREKI